MLLYNVWKDLIKTQSGGAFETRLNGKVEYASITLESNIEASWQNAADSGNLRASSINFEQREVGGKVEVRILTNMANKIFDGVFSTEADFREAARLWVEAHIIKASTASVKTQWLYAIDRVLNAYMSAVCLNEEWARDIHPP
jgi:hypothetical protein